MSGKTITRLFAPLVLVLGLVTLGIAGAAKSKAMTKGPALSRKPAKPIATSKRENN